MASMQSFSNSSFPDDSSFIERRGRLCGLPMKIISNQSKVKKSNFCLQTHKFLKF